MKAELHKKLKVFFTVTTAAFTMKHSISAAFGHIPAPTAMETLHRMALAELEKDHPDGALLDAMLFQMEKLAEQNKENL